MRGPDLARLAWRNLWRQKRRTILTLVSITFGGFLAFIMTAMNDKSFADFIDDAAQLGTGHVTIQNPEYQDRPTLSRSVQNTGAKRHLALQDPFVTRAVDRASGAAMLTTARDAFGAYFIAYDPELESPETLQFAQDMVAGEPFQTADDKGILLGRILADNLGAGLGDKIVFTLTDRSGEIVTGMERVKGILSTGAASTDAAIAMLPINTLRDVVGYQPDESSQIAIFLNDGRRAGRVASTLRPEVGGDAVLTWDEVQPEIKAFVAMKVGGARVMEIVIGVLVAAGIFSTVFMSVLERTREFGIMLAIGYSPGQLFRLVMWETGFLAMTGLLCATAFTAGPYWYLHTHGADTSAAYEGMASSMDIGGVAFDPVLRFDIYPENALIIAASIVLATMLAGIYPAWRAGRVDPVESINVI